MGFSSLADELGDVFDQRDSRGGGGRSLADEFGLDFGMDEELGDGEFSHMFLSISFWTRIFTAISCDF